RASHATPRPIKALRGIERRARSKNGSADLRSNRCSKKQPTSSAMAGPAGRVYESSLPRGSEKKKTHHPAQSKMNPIADDRTFWIAGTRLKRNRANQTVNNDQGKHVTNSTRR